MSKLLASWWASPSEEFDCHLGASIAQFQCYNTDWSMLPCVL